MFSGSMAAGSQHHVPQHHPRQVCCPTAPVCNCSCLTPSVLGFQASGLILPWEVKGSLSRSGFGPDLHNGHEGLGHGQALPA